MAFISQKIRLKLNNEQKTYFAKIFGCARFTYNWAVEKFNNGLKEGEVISALKLSKEFTKLKDSLFPFTNEVSKYATISPFIQVGKAISDFLIKKADENERLKFKKKGYFGSVSLKADGFQIVHKVNSKRDYLKLPFLDKPVKLVEKIKYKGKMFGCTLSRKHDFYYVSLNFKVSNEELKLKKGKLFVRTNKGVGIDLGIASTLTFSIPFKINMPSLVEEETQFVRMQRRLDKKVHPRTKGDKTQYSKNYLKHQKSVYKKFLHIYNIRKDFLEKATSFIVRNFDFVCMENLNVKGMLQKHSIAKYLQKISFYEMKIKIKNKLEMVNKTFIEADRYFPSSKICSRCGLRKNELSLTDRIFRCEACGNEIDRDYNAAKNLKHYLIKQIGLVPAKFTLADLNTLLSDLKRNRLIYTKVETRNQHSLKFKDVSLIEQPNLRSRT